MAANTANLEVKGLARKDMTDLAKRAKRFGMTPERYVRELVQEDLAIDRKAHSTTISELMGPGREIDEAELDRVVEAVRTRHHRGSARKR